jgi:ankyrin repeat protein
MHFSEVFLDCQDGDTPLHWACTNGFVDVVQVLLDHGADYSHANTVRILPSGLLS